MTRAIFLPMAFSKADLASMVKRAMFFLACAIVESEAKPFTLFRSRFEELLGDQTPVFALAFAFPMLATTFAMGSKHLTVTGRAEEVSRCSQRNQKMLVDQLSRIPRIFQSFLQR